MVGIWIDMKNLSQKQTGILFAISAFFFWGTIPIYFKQVASVDPFEVLIHRVIWSVVVLVFLLYFTKQFTQVKKILKDFTQLKYLFLSSFFVSFNWLVFIYAISVDKILETSLGYFINPLVFIFMGFIFFSERMNTTQKIAVGIAFFAIVIQIVSFGSIPIIALTLAFSFVLYGMVRKKASVPSIAGLFVETLLLLPFALAYLFYLISNDTSALVGDDNYISFMLVFAGIITVLPLLWFNSAVTRLPLTSIGILQYIGPSVSFLIAIYIYNEPFTLEKIVTFSLVWLALAIFSYDALKK
jgi:chloramphenicol-sensitive protein RarD